MTAHQMKKMSAIFDLCNNSNIGTMQLVSIHLTSKENKSMVFAVK